MQKAISKYWPVFVLPTLIAFIIGFIWPFIWGIYLSFQGAGPFLFLSVLLRSKGCFC